jgi:hypothetical protein
MNDSIIRFKNNLNDALNLDLNDNAILGYANQIVLNPFKFYTQKTPIDMIFEGAFTCYITDVCGTNLQDITEHVYISENTNGNYIEFATNYDFQRQLVLVKLVNNINPLDVWYSNPMFITENVNLTTEFDYKNVSDAFMQSVALECFFTRSVQESEVKSYIQETGTKVSGKATFTEMRKFVFEMLDNFVYRRLNLLLAKTQVYAQGIRVTDKPLLKDSDIRGNQNTFSSEFIGAVNYNDTYTRTLQIAQPLALVSNYPNSIYTLASINDLIQLVFNHDIDTDNTDLQISLYKDDIFISYLDLIKINFITFEQVYTFVSNGSYKIVIPANKYSSILYGSLPYTELTFTIANGDYSSSHYSSDYFTN